MVPGGFIAGEDGMQIVEPSPSTVSVFDDFLGDVIADQWNSHVGSDSPAAIAVAAAAGGTLVLTTGDSNASLAADGSVLDSYLNWYAQNGGLTFSARLKVSSIATVQCCFGFTDQVSALEMPATLSGTTYTTVATDAAVFLFDTSATTDTIRCVGVANDVDATHVDTGNAWAANTYATFTIELDASGNAKFMINGVPVGVVANAVTPSVALTPVFAIRSLAAASYTMTIDYVNVSMNR